MAKTKLNKHAAVKMIYDHFNEEEVQLDICLPLTIDWDDMAGESLRFRIFSLVELIERQARIGQLIETVRQARPHSDWSVLVRQETAPPPPSEGELAAPLSSETEPGTLSAPPEAEMAVPEPAPEEPGEQHEIVEAAADWLQDLFGEEEPPDETPSPQGSVYKVGLNNWRWEHVFVEELDALARRVTAVMKQHGLKDVAFAQRDDHSVLLTANGGSWKSKEDVEVQLTLQAENVHLRISVQPALRTQVAFTDSKQIVEELAALLRS